MYAGLSVFHLLFNELDSGDENDPNPDAWHLPSGKYDVPLIFHDVQFLMNGEVAFNNFYTDGRPLALFRSISTTTRSSWKTRWNR